MHQETSCSALLTCSDATKQSLFVLLAHVDVKLMLSVTLADGPSHIKGALSSKVLGTDFFRKRRKICKRRNVYLPSSSSVSFRRCCCDHSRCHCVSSVFENQLLDRLPKCIFCVTPAGLRTQRREIIIIT